MTLLDDRPGTDRRRIASLAFTLLLPFLLSAVVHGEQEPRSILFEDTAGFTHPDDTGPHRYSHVLLQHHRNNVRLESSHTPRQEATSQDVGDVAVIVDNGEIIVPAVPENRFDLRLPTALRFSPQSGGDSFEVSFTDIPLDSGFGPPLPLGDDDSEDIAFPAGFPFLGEVHASVWVNSDGNVTFGRGDSASTLRDAARLIGGPPRVAPLLGDLDPSAGGSVHADIRSDRLVVTWFDVPQFGVPNANTLQLTLWSDGTIDFVYETLELDLDAAFFAVIGIAEGDDAGPFHEIDLTEDLPATFEVGAVFEEFTRGFGPDVDVVHLARTFYQTHEDKYDFLVLFTDFAVDLRGAFAFEINVSNQTRGIGLPLFDFSSFFGSDGELESFVMMNDIGLYWPDAHKMVDPPIDLFRFFPGTFIRALGTPNELTRRARRMGTADGFGAYTLGLNSPMSIMAQEVGHRWLAFVPFVHPTKGISFDSFDLLGRAGSHWSFFFDAAVPEDQFEGDPRSSSMEGNAILDFGGNVFGDCRPGETRFRTEPEELIDGYTELDQYLMGLRLADHVGPFWYIDEPTTPSGVPFDFFRSVAAIDDIGICGKRVDMTVADIQAFPGIGPRIPALGDEDDGPGYDVKTMAFILLIQQGTPDSPAHAAAIRQIDTFRQAWEEYANGRATNYRGRFDTSLDPDVH